MNVFRNNRFVKPPRPVGIRMAAPPREESLWQAVAVLLLMAAAVVGLLFVGWAAYGPVGS